MGGGAAAVAVAATAASMRACSASRAVTVACSEAATVASMSGSSGSALGLHAREKETARRAAASASPYFIIGVSSVILHGTRHRGDAASGWIIPISILRKHTTY